MAQDKKPKTKELATRPEANVSMLQDISQATDIANKLKLIVVKQKLYTDIQGKNYVNVEGWSTLGAMLGVFPEVVKLERIETNNKIEIKYLAEVRLRTMKGHSICRAQAICSNAEKSKRNNEEYAIASMAQTRATGKAFRMSFSWVMKMAGFEATPSEEADGIKKSTFKEPVAPKA